ncbi:HAD family hydrolase [Alkalihalobacillus sp. MEB130]|uniref:HAD family hydrolase n=1 Tax=Alkalihalobacillus sp. MEB130 TaxID=2976704 RepID=UPI0028DF79F7|nr:HAD family hydrolase [Alkalihalobacillus sp. MEB130]MDT8859713.1 HAD family hydrolase [Alkalihalobacillus sp. MEB130]
MDKVILFDLDGTLLPMDTNLFVSNYIKELAPRVGHIIDPNEFTKALLAGTEAMIKNVEPGKTNEQVFEETFLALTSLKREQIWPALDEFYETVFPTLSHLSNPTPMAKQVVEEAIKQGFRVVIATNPLFPKVAIHHRLKWAGLEEVTFDLITVYEEISFTKPNKEYYQDICHRLDVKPDQCVMVGNDIQEDMVTSTIGMKTFLVEGNVIDRGEPEYRIDDRGTLTELYEKIKNKEGIFNLA